MIFFIIVILQVLLFYLLPLFSGPTDAMGMIVLMFIVTFILSLMVGVFVRERFKFLYPIFVLLLFLPLIFVFYNSSACIYLLIYFVDSFIGLLLGVLFRKIFVK